LRAITARLREVLRAEDLIGRIGGEEFLVLVEDLGLQRAEQLAERLRHALCADALELEPGPHPVTISLGVALLQEEDGGYSDLLRRADRALYRAKEAGRDRVVLAPA
jgi:diguanylate cyclase (GGDEF)-like protein